MKRCPVCNACCFDDMPVCFGCLHRFDRDDFRLRDALPSAPSNATGAIERCSVEQGAGLIKPIGHIKTACRGSSNDCTIDPVDLADIEDAGEPFVVQPSSVYSQTMLSSEPLASQSAGNSALDLQFDASKLEKDANESTANADSPTPCQIRDDCMNDKERSSAMFLAVDVGNTQTVLGLFSGQTVEKTWRVTTEKKLTSDEAQLLLISLFQSVPNLFEGIGGSALASVVPRLTDEWARALSECLGKPPVICTAQNTAGLFQADYPNPKEIGQDRIADAIALRALYGAPAIVVDFGTATNIEIIDNRGMFCGGIIAPGVETSMQALFSNASRLSVVELEDPGTVIGKNTEHAIQSGIVYGEAERVDGLLRRIFDELGYETRVVATGGLASLMAHHSRIITAIDPHLTLQGLRLLYESKAG